MTLPINTIYCIGRNYVAHIAELNSETPTEPLIFLKPNSSVTDNNIIKLPNFSQNVHYETELVIQIGQDCDNIAPENALSLISAYAVGLDLTARDVQANVKQKGLPWTKAKGFKGATCLSEWLNADILVKNQPIEFTLHLNGKIKQHGNTDLMIYKLPFIISYLADLYGLRQGDVIFTGTPEGVGKLHPGDELVLNLQHGLVQTKFNVIT